jgi:type 1 glutamine amidotransferase
MKNTLLQKVIKTLLLGTLMIGTYGYAIAQKPAFKVLAVASADPDHDPMIIKSKAWLEKIAADNNFEVVVTRDATLINDANLANFQVFVQLHLAPFDMTQPQQAALQKFIISGKGWVGVHAAGLTGTQFKGTEVPYWMWFASSQKTDRDNPG